MSTKIIKETDGFGSTLVTARTIELSAGNDVYVIYGTVGGSGGGEDHFLVDSSLAANACVMAITHVAPDFGASFRVSLVDNEYARATKNLLYSTSGTHYLSDLRTSTESLSWTPSNALDEIVVRAQAGTQREAYMLLIGDTAKVQGMYQELLAKDLRVMDSSAVSLMRDNNVPIVVFSLKEEGSLLNVLYGRGTSTTITNEGAEKP